MNVYVAKTLSHEIVVLYECKHLFGIYKRGHRQGLQKRKYEGSVMEVSTRELAYDEWMACDLSIVEETCEVSVGLP